MNDIITPARLGREQMTFLMRVMETKAGETTRAVFSEMHGL